MPSKKRFLPPPQITRWNYWLYAPPRRPYELQPTLQRNGEYPEEDPWVDLAPGEGAPDQYTKARFKSGLDASPYEALYDLAWDNKLWEQYAPAQEVLKQLAPEDRAKIIELKKARWPERSKRPQRQTKTWSKLFRDIAGDIAVFEKLCDVPLQ